MVWYVVKKETIFEDESQRLRAKTAYIKDMIWKKERISMEDNMYWSKKRRDGEEKKYI